MMYKNIYTISSILASCLMLQSCNPMKIMEKSTNLFLDGVGAVISGTDALYNRSKGKINEKKLAGKWQKIFVYKGSFQQFAMGKPSEFINQYKNTCVKDQLDGVEFNPSTATLFQYECGNVIDTKQYVYAFEKDAETGMYDNFIKIGLDDYFKVMQVSDKSLVLEGYFHTDGDTRSKAVWILNKIN